MDLQEPLNKMSTTGGTAQGTVLIADPPDVIRKKFKSAVTDSGREVRHDREEKPGVSNLIEIMSVATGELDRGRSSRATTAPATDSSRRTSARRSSRCSTRSGERYDALRADERELQRLLALGAEKARKESDPTLERMYDVMGFVLSQNGRHFGAARPRGL